MAKIKIEKIVGAVKDLNKVLGLEPPIPTKDVKEKELITALSEVVDMIDETDEIKDSTREVLVQLGFIQPDVEDDDEDVEDVEDVQPTSPTLEELMDLIADCNSTKELKELLKSESELFDGFTPSAKVKNVIDLRTAMLDFLEKDVDVEEVEEVEDVEDVKDTTEKVEKVKKPVKKEVKEKPEKTEKVKENQTASEKYTRVTAICITIANLKSPVTKDELNELSDSLYAKNGGKSNLRENMYVLIRVLPTCKFFGIKTNVL